jgi:hypothetical protein
MKLEPFELEKCEHFNEDLLLLALTECDNRQIVSASVEAFEDNAELRAFLKRQERSNSAFFFTHYLQADFLLRPWEVPSTINRIASDRP